MSFTNDGADENMLSPMFIIVGNCDFTLIILIFCHLKPKFTFRHPTISRELCVGSS